MKMKFLQIAATILIILLVTFVLQSCKVKTDPGPGESFTESGIEIIKASDPSMAPLLSDERRDTLVFPALDFSGCFNPIFTYSDMDSVIMRLLFEGLNDITSSGEITDGIADMKISADMLKYTFTIKNNVKFFDGTPVTSQDVEFVYYILHDTNYTGNIDVLKYKIKGGKDYFNLKSNKISGIRIINERQIEFTLEEPCSEAAYLFTTPIISYAYYGEDYIQGNSSYMDNLKGFPGKPMGSGQYMLDKYEAGQYISLVSNDAYRKAAPLIPNVKVLLSVGDYIDEISEGNVDICFLPMSEDLKNIVKSQGFININIYPQNSYGYIGFNNENDILSDGRVRRALSYAVNKDDIIRNLFDGYAVKLSIPAGILSWAYSETDDYDFDLEKAASILNDSGWIMNSDGLRYKNGDVFSLDFYAVNDQKPVDILCPILQNDFVSLGIQLNIVYISMDDLLNAINDKSCDMWFCGSVLPPDPSISDFFGTEGSLNKLSFGDSELDGLCKQLAQEANTKRQIEIYRDIYTFINKDNPCIPLYEQQWACLSNSRVSGLNISTFRPWTADMWQMNIGSAATGNI
ncbi:MAG: ABC transporter substrate-binding protein [Clostridiales bacterium]|jgi:peptide/nickel transport system substrate-binding protein|nr:ABC transporter substrate-binding protein [Clostridiales bacterium]